MNEELADRLSYATARRLLDDVRSLFVGFADELGDAKAKQDAMTVEFLLSSAEFAIESGLDRDAPAQLSIRTFFLAFTDIDAVLGAAAAVSIDVLREKLSQPPASTTAGILDQITDIQRADAAATTLIKRRLGAYQTISGDTFRHALRMIDEAQPGLEQRRPDWIPQSAALEAEVAEVTQRGRPPKHSKAKVKAIYDAYLQKPASQGINEFARLHGFKTRQQVQDLFDRDGLEWRGSENH